MRGVTKGQKECGTRRACQKRKRWRGGDQCRRGWRAPWLSWRAHLFFYRNWTASVLGSLFSLSPFSLSPSLSLSLTYSLCSLMAKTHKTKPQLTLESSGLKGDSFINIVIATHSPLSRLAVKLDGIIAWARSARKWQWAFCLLLSSVIHSWVWVLHMESMGRLTVASGWGILRES